MNRASRMECAIKASLKFGVGKLECFLRCLLKRYRGDPWLRTGRNGEFVRCKLQESQELQCQMRPANAKLMCPSALPRKGARAKSPTNKQTNLVSRTHRRCSRHGLLAHLLLPPGRGRRRRPQTQQFRKSTVRITARVHMSTRLPAFWGELGFSSHDPRHCILLGRRSQCHSWRS